MRRRLLPPPELFASAENLAVGGGEGVVLRGIGET
jgi:hypothetical protein